MSVTVAKADDATKLETFSDTPVAAAIFGAPVNVGLALIANVEPVPVCEAMAVALPVEVIGPVRFAFVVTVAALPVTLPAMGAVTVSAASVPTLVKLEAVTPEARVAPVRVPAAAVTVIGAVPSKFTPLMARGVARAVAVAARVEVAAFPVVLWFSVGKSAATAIVSAPVVVVDLTIPVASAAVPAE